MNLYKMVTSIFIICCFFLTPSCKKYLDEKSDRKLVVPTTIADLQALLDNSGRINNSAPETGQLSSDDYYLSDVDFNAVSQEANRRIYTWQNSFLFDAFPNNWSRCYLVVYYSNIVLKALESIERNSVNRLSYDNLKGHALFLRGYSFYQAASLWAQAYDPAGAASDMGIPLRMTDDFNVASERGNVAGTYEQITGDLKAAVSLLPVTALHVMRPSKAAAYALLARVFLAMRNYDNAGVYADSSLRLYNRLLDYNSLSATATFPFTAFNAEITFENTMLVPSSLGSTKAKVDSVLYIQYAANDLRKAIFFKSNNNGSFSFKGSYEGNDALFGGVATDETYLTRAECHARKGNTVAAMNDLDTLLVKRWKKGTFAPLTASNPADALSKVLSERRKELLMRGLRWMDIKRLNKEGANIILRRLVNGQQYVLLPNAPGYALPVPEKIIELTGMQQNPK